jgi:putative tributyrin esterase
VILPDGQYSYFTNVKHKSHARWEDAVAQVIPRDVQKRFPILTGREHTGIAGISMGGYGAVKIALKHSDQYSFAGTMSGALDVPERKASFARIEQTLRLWRIFGIRVAGRQDEDVFALLKHSSAVKQTAWFASCGEKDTLYEVNQRFAKRMQAAGANCNYAPPRAATLGTRGMNSCRNCSTEPRKSCGRRKRNKPGSVVLSRPAW